MVCCISVSLCIGDESSVQLTGRYSGRVESATADSTLTMRARILKMPYKIARLHHVNNSILVRTGVTVYHMNLRFHGISRRFFLGAVYQRVS